jgi:hypothetical protein
MIGFINVKPGGILTKSFQLKDVNVKSGGILTKRFE